MSAETKSATGPQAVVSMFSTALAVVGGFGSLAAAVGYVSRYAYFTTLGAQWLMRELTFGEIVFSSSAAAELAVACFLIARWMPFRSPRAYRLTVALSMIAGGFLLDLVLFNARVASLEAHWYALATLGLALLLTGSAFMATLLLEDLSRDAEVLGRTRWITFWLVVIVLVVSPILFGAIQGRRRLVRPQQEFFCVALVNEAPSSCHQAIYLGVDRVYCLGRPTANGGHEIAVYRWENVRTVIPPIH